MLCGVSDAWCTFFSAVRWLFGSSMVGFGGGFVCAIVFVVLGVVCDAIPLLLSPCSMATMTLLKKSAIM